MDLHLPIIDANFNFTCKLISWIQSFVLKIKEAGLRLFASIKTPKIDKE